VISVRRRGLGLGCVAAVVALLGSVAVGADPAAAVTEPGVPTVVAACLGVDPGATGSQIRVGVVVSGPDGLYRAVFVGPDGPVQGEGRVAGGRGLVIVPSSGVGDYDDLVLTDVDTGQAVDRGPLGDVLPLTVGDDTIPCDPAALVVPNDTTPTTPTPTDATVAPNPDPTDVPSPDVSTAAPLAGRAKSTTTETPPWLLLAIPGTLLVIGGVVLLVRARSGSRSRPAT
jgi:hypothetical protein